jgi:hypothetical protein
MTGKTPRPDIVDELRQARAELERIQARAWESYEQGHRAFDRPARDDHAYLSTYLEAAHAHMVGEAVAQRALLGTLGLPRVREGWRRDEAEYEFGRVLSDYAYHHGRFSSDVEHVQDWIRKFGRPRQPQPEADLSSEREAER